MGQGYWGENNIQNDVMERSTFIYRFFKTLLVYYVGYLPVGYMYSNTAVTLPLLREYADIEENEGGYIFGLRGIGLVLATVFSGLFFEWYREEEGGEEKEGYLTNILGISHHKILSFSLFLCSVSLAAVPFTSNFFLLTALHFYMGVFVGFLEIGFIVQINYTWGPLSEYFLFGLDGVIGLGSILFPLIMSFMFRFTNSKDFQLRLPYLVCAIVSLLSALGLILTKSSRKPLEVEEGDLSENRIEYTSADVCASPEDSTSELTSNGSTDSKESDFSTSTTITNSSISSSSNEFSDSVSDEKKTLKSRFFQLFTLENAIHILDSVIGVIIVGSINSYIALIFSYLKENEIDSDENLSLMYSVLCVVYMLSRFSGSLVIRFISVSIYLLICLFALIIILGFFLLYPRSKMGAWVTSTLFAVFAAPVSTSLLIVCQSTYGMTLTPHRASLLFGAQFLGETTQSYLMAYLSSDKYFGSIGVVVVGFGSAVVSFLIYLVMLFLGWVYLNRKKKKKNVVK